MEGLSKNVLGYMVETSRMDPMDVSHLRATCKTLRENITDTAGQYRTLTIANIFFVACADGYPQIVVHCLTSSKSIHPLMLDAGISVGYSCGNFDCAELCFKHSPIASIETVLSEASERSDLVAIKWCIEISRKYGKFILWETRLHRILCKSCKNGILEVANYCESMIGSDFDYVKAREKAVKYDQQHMIEWCDLQINKKRKRE